MKQSLTQKQSGMDPAYAFFRHVKHIEQLANERIDYALPGDMKASHFEVLNYLVKMDKAETPAILAETFRVTRASMSNTIQKLVAREFVVLAPDPDDGRGKLVAITDQGRFAQDDALKVVIPVFADIIMALGLERFNDVLPNLELINEYMDENRGV